MNLNYSKSYPKILAIGNTTPVSRGTVALSMPVFPNLS